MEGLIVVGVAPQCRRRDYLKVLGYTKFLSTNILETTSTQNGNRAIKPVNATIEFRSQTQQPNVVSGTMPNKKRPNTH